MESRSLLPSLGPERSRSPPFRLYAVAVCACLTPLSYGVCLGFTSPAYPDMREDGFITAEENSWFSALLPLAAMLGAAVAGKGIERLGRRSVLVLTALPFIAGWIAIAVTKLLAAADKHTAKIILLYIGRVLTGLATGSGTICCPTYLAEISPKEKRGMIGSLNQLFATLGILLVYILGYFVTSWEWLAILSAIPPTCSAVLMLFCPESPRWLVSQNRDSDALESLALIRNESSDILAEVEETRNAMAQQRTGESFFDLVRKRSIYIPLIIAVGLNVFQQFSGINAMIFNAETIFADSGFRDSAKAMIILGSVNVAATVLSVGVMDKWGRRILLNLGAVGMIASLVTSGVADYLKADLPVLSLASLLAFIVFFAIGFDPLVRRLLVLRGLEFGRLRLRRFSGPRDQGSFPRENRARLRRREPLAVPPAAGAERTILFRFRLRLSFPSSSLLLLLNSRATAGKVDAEGGLSTHRLIEPISPMPKDYQPIA